MYIVANHTHITINFDKNIFRNDPGKSIEHLMSPEGAKSFPNLLCLFRKNYNAVSIVKICIPVKSGGLFFEKNVWKSRDKKN
jgi:hypothetical protein